MAIEAYAEKNCSIAKPLSFLGERWTVLILRDLFLGRRRFDEFLDRNTIPLRTSSVFACLAFIVALLNAAHEPQSFHGCCRNVFSGRV